MTPASIADSAAESAANREKLAIELVTRLNGDRVLRRDCDALAGRLRPHPHVGADEIVGWRCREDSSPKATNSMRRTS